MFIRFSNWLIRRFCNESLFEAFSGDLEEMYSYDVDAYGQRKASRKYLFNAIAFLRYHRLRKKSTTQTNNNMSLLKNYVKVSWRDLLRQRTYSTINLVGLISAFTIALMILQYVVFETGFDKFHEDGDRIYRVVNDRFQNGELIQHGTITYPVVGPTMAEDFAEIEAFTRMLFLSRAYIGFNEELFLTEQVLFADEHFLNFFSFEVIEGNADNALLEPSRAVLTESYARKLLSSDESVEQIVGKDVEVYGRPVKVTGLIKDAPKQSHLQFDMLLSFNTYVQMSNGAADNSWKWSDFYHYIKLKPNASLATLEDNVAEFGPRYFKKGEVSGSEEQFYLQPLEEAHLDNSMQYEIGQVVDGKIVWTMLIIAGFILLIAWINYINLSTSRALQRAKEVGVRKSVGANQTQVIVQFIIETLLINSIALFTSLMLVWVLQPFFNHLTGLALDLHTLWNGELVGVAFPIFFGLVFFISLIIISLYPASLLAGFKARDVIGGKYKLKGKVAWLRKGLVLFQFMAAVILINGALAIADQLDYLLNKDLGMNIDNTLIVFGPGMTDWDSTYLTKVDHFRNEVQQLHGVQTASTSSRVAGQRMGRQFNIRNKNKADANNLTLNVLDVDHNYEELYGIEVIAGRGFESTDHNFDGSKVDKIIINQAAVSYLGFEDAEDALGGTLVIYDRDWYIVGVVNDFHQMTLHEKIEPIVLLPFYDTDNNYSIKLSGDPSDAVLASIQEVYEEVFPGNYFDYYYLEDYYNQNYQSEMRLSTISQVFTVLSIIMVIMGLYGLTTMNLQKKMKEIGIRKVLGAKVSGLLVHLSKDFAYLLLLALVLGIPVGLYFIDLWKANFAYTTQLGMSTIVLAVVLIVLFTSLPILLHTKKVASSAPIQSLRDE